MKRLFVPTLSKSRLPLERRATTSSVAKSLLLGVLLFCANFAPAQTAEREEIVAVLRELEFIRERVQALAQKHGQSKAKIRFNYQALLEQLRATENGIRAYLNAEIDTIHTQPPKPVDQELFRVRRN